MKIKRKRAEPNGPQCIIVDPDGNEVDARYKSENLAVVQAMNAALDAQWASRGKVEAKTGSLEPRRPAPYRPGWDAVHLAALQERNGGLVAVHRLTREAAPDVLRDRDGQAFTRLGVERAAQYLVRPDGYIGYRSEGIELGGVDRYLARWLPGAAREPDRSRHAD
jgi:hypothetical protein